ncbi:10080_t:CDS:2, partial [Racocetra persica]
VLQQTLDATGFELQIIMTDIDPAMNVACQVKYMNSYHVHCIWHMSQNLPKRLKAKLESKNFKEFICDFWKTWNSLSIEVFEYRFQSLLKKYPTVASSSSISDVVEALKLRMQREELNKKINKQMCESVLYKCEKLDIDHALEDQLYSDENELINMSVEESQAYDDIKDPVVCRSKGRHQNKQLKAFNEETNNINSNKKQQDTADSDSETRRRCRLYHKSGYYTPKCPNKKNAM